jgi:hypothetical protein
VNADLPDKAHVKSSGAFDPKRRRWSSTVKETGGTAPQSGQRIVVGTDMFTREKSSEGWSASTSSGSSRATRWSTST